jgi:hypothetical protein
MPEKACLWELFQLDCCSLYVSSYQEHQLCVPFTIVIWHYENFPCCMLVAFTIFFYIYNCIICLLTLVSHLLAGVDFKIKFLTVSGKKLKLTIWDTGELNTLEYGRYHFCFSYDIFDCSLEHTMLPKPICMQFYPYHMFFYCTLWWYKTE